MSWEFARRGRRVRVMMVKVWWCIVVWCYDVMVLWCYSVWFL